jgi:hypothetical protein
VAGSCEDSNEFSSSTKAGEFSDCVSDSVSEEGLCS